MNHELRTPLNAIIGYSDMLIEDFEDNPDVCGDLNRFRNARKRLLTMISEILDLAKIDAGRVKVDIKPLKISGLPTSYKHVKARLLHRTKTNWLLTINLGKLNFTRIMTAFTNSAQSKWATRVNSLKMAPTLFQQESTITCHNR